MRPADLPGEPAEVMTNLRPTVGCLAVFLTACGGKGPEPTKAEAAKPATKEAAIVAEAIASSQQAKAKAEAEGEEGCLHGKTHDDSCDQAQIPAPGSVGHFGAPFSVAAAEPLAKVLASDPLPSTPVRVQGTVASVCQKKGCWMVLADGDVKARILMKDHAFALPTDARGKRAEVEGTIEKRTLSKAQVEHLAKDAGEDPAKAGGERVEFVLTATGVELAPTS
ncbi:MAG: DUF4920 domain-containing protein [Deltaproteobacteria bacterium]|nr:MAG: DUF4920 domain-containing protein [Deltaproteobacteria bacterium]